MGHFQLFSMFFKFSVGHFLSIYTDFYGPFSKLMGLWRMAPYLPNHCNFAPIVYLFIGIIPIYRDIPIKREKLDLMITNLDVTLFCAFLTQIREICINLLPEKLKPHRKNDQLTTNKKNFTVENVLPSLPPTMLTICTCEDVTYS